jgi:hypothetical protein
MKKDGVGSVFSPSRLRNALTERLPSGSTMQRKDRAY